MRDHSRPSTGLRWATAGRTAALAAFDRGDDNADLAELTGDAAPAAEVFRAGDGAVVAALRFEHGDLSLDLQVRADGDLRTVSGLAAGNFDHAVLDVRRPGSTDSLRVGEDGRFSLYDLPRGPISLSLRRSGLPPVVTEWFTI